MSHRALEHIACFNLINKRTLTIFKLALLDIFQTFSLSLSMWGWIRTGYFPCRPLNRIILRIRIYSDSSPVLIENRILPKLWWLSLLQGRLSRIPRNVPWSGLMLRIRRDPDQDLASSLIKDPDPTRVANSPVCIGGWLSPLQTLYPV